MKKSIFSIVMIIGGLTAAEAVAQDHTVRGKVMEANQAPVQFATALLLPAQDTSRVRGVTTDESGTFRFEGVGTGTYILKTSFLGFKPTRNVFTVTAGEPESTHTIVMESQGVAIQEVKVEARRPHIVQKEDRMVVHLANSPLATGHSALEVLEKSPGVYINPKSESISLNGKGVTVMLDGKKTHLATADLATLLKSFQSQEIDHVELITSPGAKYDAEGVGGIVNIVTKKGTMEGTKGSVNVGAGYTGNNRQSGGLSLQHKKGKLVLSGAYNVLAKQYKTEEQAQVSYLNTADGRVTNRHHTTGVNPTENLTHSYRGSLDWDISQNQSLSLGFRGFNFNKEREGVATTQLIDFTLPSEATMVTRRTNASTSQQYAGSLNYKRKFSASQLLYLSVDYSDFQSREQNHIQYAFAAGSDGAAQEGSRLRNHLPTDIRILSGQVDYEQPLGKGKFEAGLKLSSVSTDNDARYEVLGSSQTWVNDASRTNYFAYQEQIAAAYMTYRGTWAGLSYRLGLRGENTFSKGKLITTQQTSNRDYLDFFPSMLVSRAFGKDHHTSLSYSRRLRRPNYQDLNPFIYVQDIYNYSQGNPSLNAQYTHNLDLAYVFRNTYNVSLGYSHTKGGIAYVTRRSVDNPLVVYTRAENIDEQIQYVLNLSVPVSPRPWWDIYNSLSGSYSRNTTDYGTEGDQQVRGLAGTYGLSNNFKVKGGWHPSISAYFQSATPYGLIVLKPQYQVNLGLQKKMLADNLILRASYNDIFRSARAFAQFDFGSVRGSNDYRWDSNYLVVSLTYNFGNQKVKGAGNTKKSSNEEESRIKQ